MYSDGGEGTRMMYKTTMIRVAAEYEIYHSIFGHSKNMNYDGTILGKIRSFMEMQDISYKEIKSRIESLYK